MERLQKIIAQAGVASRRKAEELILAGRVTVDGVVIDTLGFKAKKGSEVCVDGKKLDGEDKVYYVMYKPKKVICTLNDEHDRNTVVQLMKDVPQRIFPVGRLDYDTTGVLILTNDGEFANEMTHPRYHLSKTYEVHANGILTTPQIKNLEHGIQLDDGSITLPAKVWITHKDFGRKTTDFDLTIKEGKNHQVKRMVEALGYEVTRLHRKSFAFIKVNDMVPGEYRRLKPFEVKQLRKLAEEGEME